MNTIFYLLQLCCVLVGTGVWLNMRKNIALLKKMVAERRLGFIRDEQVKFYQDRIVSAALSIIGLNLLFFLFLFAPTIIKQLAI